MNDLYTKLDNYGVRYSGEQVDHRYHEAVSKDEPITLSELNERGGRVSRVRLLGEYGRYDVSYIHGILPDKTVIRLRLDGLDNCSLIPRRQIKGEFIRWAKNQGVYAKGLGLLDDGNWSMMH